MCCNVLQCAVTSETPWCLLSNTATCFTCVQHRHKTLYHSIATQYTSHPQHTATHCNTLQHTATHCNTLQHTATHCNTLQHAATHTTTHNMLVNHNTIYYHNGLNIIHAYCIWVPPQAEVGYVCVCAVCEDTPWYTMGCL